MGLAGWKKINGLSILERLGHPNSVTFAVRLSRKGDWAAVRHHLEHYLSWAGPFTGNLSPRRWSSRVTSRWFRRSASPDAVVSRVRALGARRRACRIGRAAPAAIDSATTTYRRGSRSTRTVEADLRKVLAYADADHPILLELQREESLTTGRP